MTSPRPTEINLDAITIRPRQDFKTWASTHGDEVVRALNRGYFVVDLGDLKGNQRKLFEALPALAAKKNDKYESSINILEATADGAPEKFISMLAKGDNKLRETILGYARTATQELEGKVREMVLKHYKLSKESNGYIFRMMRNKEEVTLGCSDNKNRIEFLAVLNLNGVDSLDMEYDGNWVKIHVKPSTFLIMAGKPLHKDWSEGKINPLGLRVKMHGNEAKYSVGLFSYLEKQVESSSGS